MGLLSARPGALLVPHPEGSVLHVHVQPRAGRDAVAGRHGDALKVRVRAAPVEGRATEAARLVVAAAFGLVPAAVRVVSGDRSRLKRFLLAGLGPAEAAARMERILAGQ